MCVDATLVVGVKANNPSTLIITKSPCRPIGRSRPEDGGAPRSFDFLERVPLPTGGCGVNFIMQGTASGEEQGKQGGEVSHGLSAQAQRVRLWIPTHILRADVYLPRSRIAILLSLRRTKHRRTFSNCSQRPPARRVGHRRYRSFRILQSLQGRLRRRRHYRPSRLHRTGCLR